jgi:hypothetical protein
MKTAPRSSNTGSANQAVHFNGWRFFILQKQQKVANTRRNPKARQGDKESRR